MGEEITDAKKAEAVKRFQLQRKISRTLAVQFLFQCDLRNDWESLTMETLELFKEQSAHQPDPNDEDMENATIASEYKHAWSYAEKLIRGVIENRAALDELIVQAAANWSLSRMGVVDRTILRLGTLELTRMPGITPGTAINEAIELAKDFGQPDSPRFINGVLDKIRRLSSN